jgi:chromosome partitioning protein
MGVKNSADTLFKHLARTPCPTLSMILAIINQKGGVGKTTTTVNLGAAFAQTGRRVLLLDLDPQGSLTSFTDTDGAVSLLNCPTLTVKTASAKNLASILRGTDHDIALIDCPPTLGPAHAAALLQSDIAIAPMPPKFLDAHGLAQLTQSIEAASERGNPSLKFKILLTMRDGRVGTHRDMEEAVRGALGSRIFSTVVPHAAVFDKAALAHLSVLQLEPRSAGARAYRALAEEILETTHGS